MPLDVSTEWVQQIGLGQSGRISGDNLKKNTRFWSFLVPFKTGTSWFIGKKGKIQQLLRVLPVFGYFPIQKPQWFHQSSETSKSSNTFRILSESSINPSTLRGFLSTGAAVWGSLTGPRHPEHSSDEVVPRAHKSGRQNWFLTEKSKMRDSQGFQWNYGTWEPSNLQPVCMFVMFTFKLTSTNWFLPPSFKHLSSGSHCTSRVKLTHVMDRQNKASATNLQPFSAWRSIHLLLFSRCLSRLPTISSCFVTGSTARTWAVYATSAPQEHGDTRT